MKQMEGGVLLSPHEFALVWSDGKWGLHVPAPETLKNTQLMPTEALALTELLLRIADSPEQVAELAEACMKRRRT